MVKSITSIFDPITKNPRTSTVYGSELLANVAELPVDNVAGALGGKVLKFLMGLGFAYGGKKATGRMSEELHEIASHMLFRVLDPTPEQVFAIKADFSKVKEAFAFGNPMGVLKSLFRPQALQKFGLGFGAGSPGLTPSPTITGPSTLPVTPPVGMATLTGLLPRPVPVDVPGQFQGSLGSNKLITIH
jgi:hypothetical protein